MRACERAGVRAGVRKIELKRGLLRVRAWSVKREGVRLSTKPHLLYNALLNSACGVFRFALNYRPAGSCVSILITHIYVFYYN